MELLEGHGDFPPTQKLNISSEFVFVSQVYSMMLKDKIQVGLLLARIASLQIWEHGERIAKLGQSWYFHVYTTHHSFFRKYGFSMP